MKTYLKYKLTISKVQIKRIAWSSNISQNFRWFNSPMHPPKKLVYEYIPVNNKNFNYLSNNNDGHIYKHIYHIYSNALPLRVELHCIFRKKFEIENILFIFISLAYSKNIREHLKYGVSWSMSGVVLSGESLFNRKNWFLNSSGLSPEFVCNSPLLNSSVWEAYPGLMRDLMKVKLQRISKTRNKMTVNELFRIME